jgi:co-chaperonin GroES (HSP10)
MSVARDEIATKREKKEGFGARVNHEVPVDQLEHLAVAKFAKSALAYDSLEQAFPHAEPNLLPFGTDVLVQIRTPRRFTKGGIYVPDEGRETDLWNMQVAKVIALGAVAFCNRETLHPWPEGAWCKPGHYVRVPKYGGDRWWVDVPGSEDGKALFVLFDDLVMKGRIPDDKVLDMVAYI